MKHCLLQRVRTPQKAATTHIRTQTHGYGTRKNTQHLSHCTLAYMDPTPTEQQTRVTALPSPIQSTTRRPVLRPLRITKKQLRARRNPGVWPRKKSLHFSSAAVRSSLTFAGTGPQTAIGIASAEQPREKSAGTSVNSPGPLYRLCRSICKRRTYIEYSSCSTRGTMTARFTGSGEHCRRKEGKKNEKKRKKKKDKTKHHFAEPEGEQKGTVCPLGSKQGTETRQHDTGGGCPVIGATMIELRGVNTGGWTGHNGCYGSAYALAFWLPG